MTLSDDDAQARIGAGSAVQDPELAAAYALVFDALRDPPTVPLPHDFAEAVAARVYGEPARLSVYERWVLPSLTTAAAIVAAERTWRLHELFEAGGALHLNLAAAGDGGLSLLACAVVLTVIALADRGYLLVRAKRRA